MIIRPAKMTDHASLVNISKQSGYTKSFSNQVMFSGEEHYRKGWIWGAFEGKRAIGLACVRHKVRVPETFLYFLVVDKEHRSKGIGQALLYRLMESSPNEVLALNVAEVNTRAVQFYEGLGAVLVGPSKTGVGLLRYEWRPGK